jgi:hypothetical protein
MQEEAEGGEEVKFEIINPSDKAFIESDSFETACLATCILGQGKYGLREVGGDKRMPVFLFGGHDEFFAEKFGKPFEESLNATDKAEIARALETVSLAGERTSLNDIVKRAKSYAKVLEK